MDCPFCSAEIPPETLVQSRTAVARCAVCGVLMRSAGDPAVALLALAPDLWGTPMFPAWTWPSPAPAPFHYTAQPWAVLGTGLLLVVAWDDTEPFSVRQVGAITGLSRKTIQQYCREGLFSGATSSPVPGRVVTRWRIPRRAVADYLGRYGHRRERPYVRGSKGSRGQPADPGSTP